MKTPYTTEETAALLMQHVRHMITYWDSRAMTNREKLEGLAFSIFSALDGSNVNLPAFIVAPDPHPEDQAWHQGRGERWITPQNHEVAEKIEGNLGGNLHTYFGFYMRHHLTPSSD